MQLTYRSIEKDMHFIHTFTEFLKIKMPISVLFSCKYLPWESQIRDLTSLLGCFESSFDQTSTQIRTPFGIRKAILNHSQAHLQEGGKVPRWVPCARHTLNTQCGGYKQRLRSLTAWPWMPWQVPCTLLPHPPHLQHVDDNCICYVISIQ